MTATISEAPAADNYRFSVPHSLKNSLAKARQVAVRRPDCPVFFSKSAWQPRPSSAAQSKPPWSAIVSNTTFRMAFRSYFRGAPAWSRGPPLSWSRGQGLDAANSSAIITARLNSADLHQEPPSVLPQCPRGGLIPGGRRDAGRILAKTWHAPTSRSRKQFSSVLPPSRAEGDGRGNDRVYGGSVVPSSFQSDCLLGLLA